MFRITVVNFLLLALLACPFNCMGAFRSLLHPNGSASMGCSCCTQARGGECEEKQNKPGPASLASDLAPGKSCAQCLCSGAVVGKDVSSSDMSVSQSLSSAPREMDWLCSSASLEPSHRQPLWPAQGAFVRILYQSFLI